MRWRASAKRRCDRCSSEADKHLDDVRLVGDAVIAAFFAADKQKKREASERAKVLKVLEVGGTDWQQKLMPAVAGLRNGEKPLHPFHFEIEFPEVFDRDNPGFDAVVGNPPFAGKNTIGQVNAPAYLGWLKQIHASKPR